MLLASTVSVAYKWPLHFRPVLHFDRYFHNFCHLFTLQISLIFASISLTFLGFTCQCEPCNTCVSVHVHFTCHIVLQAYAYYYKQQILKVFLLFSFLKKLQYCSIGLSFFFFFGTFRLQYHQVLE